MEILFVTDFVCPYCIVAKEALNQALADLGMEADIKIQPYELTEEPKERVDTFHDEVRRERYKILEEPARELGLDLKIPPAVIPRPYTRLAFEGWHYAQEKGVGNQYADKVYDAYFVEQKDIGRIDVLTELAGSVGLNSEEFRKALEEGKYTQAQKKTVAYAREVFQIQHVPTIYIDGEKIEFQAYQKENWLQFFHGRQQTSLEKQQEAEDVFGCGINGCQ